MPASRRLHDPKRCFNQATHGITSGPHGRVTCRDHLADSTDAAIDAAGGPVMVYALTTAARCGWRYPAEGGFDQAGMHAHDGLAPHSHEVRPDHGGVPQAEGPA